MSVRCGKKQRCKQMGEKIILMNFMDFSNAALLLCCWFTTLATHLRDALSLFGANIG